MAKYESELDQTRPGWSNNTGPADELAHRRPECVDRVHQPRSRTTPDIHYHSVYWDKTNDYGATTQLAAGRDRSDHTTGNQVIVQIQPDAWAAYAHLQPGSIVVAVGDEVVTGQPLGRLGNSGNSLAPHLHFGLLAGPDSGTANSLPFVLDQYTVSNSVDPASYLAAFAGAGPLQLRTDTEPAVQSGTLPLNLAVIDVR